jgi:hypothetical protein
VALEAAEKGQIRDEFEQDIPRRLKPFADLIGFIGTAEAVPLQNSWLGASFSAACEARANFVGLNVRAEARTLHVADLFRGSLEP